MDGNETAAPVRAFNRAYINGEFVTPHGTQVVDLVNPANNGVIGKVTMADEIDTRRAPLPVVLADEYGVVLSYTNSPALPRRILPRFGKRALP
jgi:hypothetical protein